jgi:hypothetical protein
MEAEEDTGTSSLPGTLRSDLNLWFCFPSVAWDGCGKALLDQSARCLVR